jgi:hypothetical protein
MCNGILQGLGVSWVKEGSDDDGRGESGANNSRVYYEPGDLSAVLVLGPLAMLPWVCHRTLAPVTGGGLRTVVATALAAVGARMLATGAGADALGRTAGQGAAEVLRAAAAGFLPWVIYWASSMAAMFLVPLTAVQAGEVRFTVAIATHGIV